MTLVVEGSRSLLLGGQAFLLDDSREMAWAERHIRKHPTIRYLVGRYVEADNANSNGHVFALDELAEAHKNVANTPLNMVHREHYIVGHYMAAEIMHPTEEAGEGLSNPYVEALAAFYRYYFPVEFAQVERAHKEGSLFFSMECVPQSLTCGDGTCGESFEYAGRSSPTYCDHLNKPGAMRRLNNPNFTGGALIVPPVKPGWKRADITEVSRLMAEHSEQADQLYQEVKEQMPDQDVASWEMTVAALMRMAYEDLEGEKARDFNTDKRKQLAKEGKALPDGSYPIENTDDLANAIQAIGRAPAGKRAQVKAHIKKRAAALGATSKIPSDW